MPHERFFELFPDLARKETRSVIWSAQNNAGIPAGEYALEDFYCNEANCDCRNVLIRVLNLRTLATEAMISYGWESMRFYEKWMGVGKGEEPDLENLKGPALKYFTEQGKFAPQWLTCFKALIKGDKEYAQRLERHYKLFREMVDQNKEK